MTFDEWLEYGMSQQWVGMAVCSTHDGTPLSAAEVDEFEQGDEPCVHVLRLYDSPEHAAAVREFHAPSRWRETNARSAKEQRGE